MDSTDRWVARAGWSLTAQEEGLDLGALLDRLECEMPAAQPEVQWKMNSCHAVIGIHHANHR